MLGRGAGIFQTNRGFVTALPSTHGSLYPDLPSMLEEVPPMPAGTQVAATPDGHDMFRVDVAGLRRKFAHRSKKFLLYELYQNAVDEDVTRVVIELTPMPGGERCRLVVEDDSPEGFKDLTHSYTLYADSTKLHNPEQRGIWNLGEKLVLAFCTQATIASTRGTVRFQDGRRFHSGARRLRGTRFEGEILMNAQEYETCCQGMASLIPPAAIEVSFNGSRLQAPPYVKEFTTTLPTTIGDREGGIRRTRRKTIVRLYEPGEKTAGWIYEMGIPVVVSGTRWHCDVQQRVPLNMQRDNVTPAYLQELRVAVLNATHDLLDEDDVLKDWARAATNDRRCVPEATTRALDLRFGERRVSYDPSDREANKKAMAEGYSVVHGGSLSKQEWSNAREAGAIQPAGQVTPSRREEPIGEGQPVQITPEIAMVEAYIHRIAPRLIGHDVTVRIVDKPTWMVAATFARGGAELTLNLGTLGSPFFQDRSWEGLQRINELLIHEFAHEYTSDHFTTKFHDSVGMLGARLANLALRAPEVFGGMINPQEGHAFQTVRSHPVRCTVR